ncbi:hypothetical protein PP586_gp57 [Pseudoalteromonas phage vB_PspS-H40/1]|uniref:hypothetical protein n=1 Tax=Pseudoalteromonas phage vB_PspS-H40/1 TaxID=1856120 RepID=UPI0007DDC1E7|nr:hypothetical protein PP586_gp57 [Pseudoalteromonas phage vB_PspS-H40/1]ANI22074.1 hypothetical protein H401_57 [Pseudoalteromonas phage vB_PspS-H40/1]
MVDKLLRLSLYVCVISFLALAALNIAGTLKIHFIWVVSPLWIPLAIFIAVSSAALLVAGLIDLITEGK